MRAADRIKWVKALRSGRYKQGKYALHPRSGGYCCLGVACRALNHSCHEASGYRWLQKRLELTVRDTNKLAAMNDNQGKSFTQIARYIETRFKKRVPRRA